MARIDLHDRDPCTSTSLLAKHQPGIEVAAPLELQAVGAEPAAARVGRRPRVRHDGEIEIAGAHPAKQHCRASSLGVRASWEERTTKREAELTASRSNAGLPLVSTIPKSMARATRSSFMRHFNKLSEEILCAVGIESGLSPPNLAQYLRRRHHSRRRQPRGHLDGPLCPRAPPDVRVGARVDARPAACARVVVGALGIGARSSGTGVADARRREGALEKLARIYGV